MTAPDAELPLSRFTVLDLTRVRAGPTAVRQLADWGANVIKIEPPPERGDDGLAGPRHGPDFQNLHRNKRSLTLDLKASDGLAVFLAMAKATDVVVENFRPAVKYRLGIDYDSLRETNPRLIYASISGFGEDGPYRERPGFDQIAQGMGGLMSVTGLPGQGPVRAGIAVADTGAGLYCAFGILAALLERETSGKGQWVQTSLLAAQVAMLDFQAARWLIGKEVPGQAGNHHPTYVPMGAYRTKDGHINIGAAGDAMYARFCRAIGAEDLLDHPDFKSPAQRSKARAAYNALLAPYIAKRTSAEWVEILNHAGVPCGPINAIDEVFADPQVRHLGLAQPVDHPSLGKIDMVGQAVSLSRTPSRMRTASPEPGQHTDEVLREFGYDDDAIADLHRRHIV